MWPPDFQILYVKVFKSTIPRPFSASFSIYRLFRRKYVVCWPFFGIFNIIRTFERSNWGKCRFNHKKINYGNNSYLHISLNLGKLMTPYGVPQDPPNLPQKRGFCTHEWFPTLKLTNARLRPQIEIYSCLRQSLLSAEVTNFRFASERQEKDS